MLRVGNKDIFVQTCARLLGGLEMGNFGQNCAPWVGNKTFLVKIVSTQTPLDWKPSSKVWQMSYKFIRHFAMK